MKNLIDLTNKHIVIAGASSGIGKQTALTLNEAGARIVLIARREDLLLEVQDCLSGNNNGYICADLSQLDDIEDVSKKVLDRFGPIDGLVYAAGVGLSLPFKMFTPEKVRRVFDINFFAFVEMVRQFTKKGHYNTGTSIVGISSIASQRGDKSHMAYSASKAAMDGAVRCIAKELAPKGIRINTVAPAMTATEMYIKYLEKYGDDSPSNKELLERQYLGVANTNEISSVIAFLLSPAASFITGDVIPIDGGYLSS